MLKLCCGWNRGRRCLIPNKPVAARLKLHGEALEKACQQSRNLVCFHAPDTR